MTPFEVKTQPRVDRPGLRAFEPGRIVVTRSAHLSAIMHYLERKTPSHDTMMLLLLLTFEGK